MSVDSPVTHDHVVAATPVQGIEPQGPRLHANRWWLLSILISLILLALLVLLWVIENRERELPQHITNQQELEALLDAAWDERDDPDAAEVRTGVFVESLSFVSSSDVHLSAYVWQVFPPGQRDIVDEGFVVPEMVDSEIEPRLDYRVTNPDGSETVGWYLEGVVRQPFTYHDYPFDHKVIWLRLWPESFDRNVVLIPHFNGYPCADDPTSVCLQPTDRSGLDRAIVMGVWQPEATYFDYNIATYDTNFGIDGYVGQREFPELRFNVEVRRNFQSAFIINLVPLLLVAILGFGGLLTITREGERAGVYGFSVAGTLGTLSALFFVVLLAHIQLRTQFAGEGVVYLEYFYFVMYVALFAVAATTYLATAEWSRDHPLISTGDMLIPKLTYWPLILLTLVVITLLTLGV